MSAPHHSHVNLGIPFTHSLAGSVVLNGEQTFSALGSGTILTWTKGFSTKNAIRKDVVKLLQDAFNRKHMHVKCVALVNDVRVSILVSRQSLASTINSCVAVRAIDSRCTSLGHTLRADVSWVVFLARRCLCRGSR